MKSPRDPACVPFIVAQSVKELVTLQLESEDIIQKAFITDHLIHSFQPL